MKILLVITELFHADRRTDMRIDMRDEADYAVHIRNSESGAPEIFKKT